MPDSARGVLIRRRLATGELPRGSARAWAGKGGPGLPCDACGESIASTDVEVELELNRLYRFHGDCFRIWTVLQATS
jgi:hypothetical protein